MANVLICKDIREYVSSIDKTSSFILSQRLERFVIDIQSFNIKSVYIDDYKLVMVFLDIKFCENNSFLQDLLVSKILWKLCHVEYIIVVFKWILKHEIIWKQNKKTFKLQLNNDMKHKISRVVFKLRSLCTKFIETPQGM